jgi:predicted hydrocarbon binding protein
VNRKHKHKKPLHTCGKRRFPDRIAAVLDMQRIQRRKDSNRDFLPVRVYECPDCHGWHMTHKEAQHAGA